MAAQLWTNEFLQDMRKVGDPFADAVMKDLFQENHLTTVNTLLKDSLRNGDPLPASAPQALRDYIASTSQLPKWADPALIERGEAIFNRYGPEIVLILHCYSLPSCYAARRGVKVLYETTRLASNPERRVVETAQMVIDVMAPGGLTRKDGSGLRSAQKVRLMHAAVRQLLLRKGNWDEAELGVPLNQEDLAGTLNTFGWLVIDGLKKCGVTLSRDETLAYMHAWNVVGHIMGVREDLLPHTLAEGEELTRLIANRHFEACPEGRAMMTALLEMLEYIIPGNVFDGVPATLTRFLVGDRVADLLAVPPSDWTQKIVKPLRFLSMVVDGLGDHIPSVAKLNSVLGRQILTSMLWMMRGKDRPRFHIPSELAQHWRLNWNP